MSNRVFSILLIILITSTVQASELLVGINFNNAKEHLRQGQAVQAIQALTKIKSKPGAEDWSTIYLCESQLQVEDYVNAKLSLEKLPATGLVSLYKEKLRIEHELLSNPKPNYGKIVEKLINLKAEGHKQLSPELRYVEALIDSKQNKLSVAIKKLQSIRLTYPKTLAAAKAYRLQQSIEEMDFANKKNIFTPKFYLSELVTLQAQGLNNAAYDLLVKLEAEPDFKTQLQSKQFFVQKLTILKRVNKQDERKEYLVNVAKNADSSLYRDTLEELTRIEWNKNEYAEAEKWLRKIGTNSRFSLYIMARISEEKGELEQAVKHYRTIIGAGVKDDYFRQSSLRLGWLYLKQDKELDAIQVLTKLKKSGVNLNYYDYQAVNYWLDKVQQNKTLTMNSDILSDPRLYYFWINKGETIATPSNDFNPPADFLFTKSKKCTNQDIAIGSQNESKLKHLATYGLYDLVREEVDYLTRNTQNDESAVRARAKLILDMGATSESFMELRELPSVYSSLEKLCLTEVIDILYPNKYWDLFVKEANNYKIDPLLLISLARTESAFNPLALSHSGAQGLMQLMPQTAEMEGFMGYQKGEPERIFLPEVNIALGAKHIKRLYDHYNGKWHLIIAAYNAGASAVDRWLQRYPDTSPELWVEFITYQETRNYVKKVLGTYWTYRNRMEKVSKES